MAEKNKVMVMAQEIKALEEERDFLRLTVLKLLSKKHVSGLLFKLILLKYLAVTKILNS